MVKCNGPACGLDRLEAGAGDFLGLDKFLNQAKTAGICQGIEDMLQVDGGGMKEFWQWLFSNGVK